MKRAERLLREQQARDAFERNLERLRFEVRMGTPRRHLDVLTELLRHLLRELGDSVLKEQFTARLREAEELVATRHNLRLVKGFQ